MNLLETCFFAVISSAWLILIGVIAALAAVWLFLNREKPLPPAPPEDLDLLTTALNESSTEFDLPDFPDFLKRVALHVSGGFGEKEIAKLTNAAEQLPHNRESLYEFQVGFQGKPTPLQVRLFKDDISSIAVYFFTSKPLADLLDEEMERFFAEHGM